jgi:hypothetical protein
MLQKQSDALLNLPNLLPLMHELKNMELILIFKESERRLLRNLHLLSEVNQIIRDSLLRFKFHHRREPGDRDLKEERVHFIIQFQKQGLFRGREKLFEQHMS